jgi:hypothetical protein
MSDGTPFPHTWAEWIRLLIAAFLGFSTTLLPALFRRKQSAAETEKTKAETQHIQLTDEIAKGELLLKLMQAGAQAVDDVARLRKERDFWEGKAEAERSRADLAEHELDRIIRIGRETP